MRHYVFVTVLAAMLLAPLPNVWAQQQQQAPMATPANATDDVESEEITTDQVGEGEDIHANTKVEKAKARDAKASYPKSKLGQRKQVEVAATPPSPPTPTPVVPVAPVKVTATSKHESKRDKEFHQWQQKSYRENGFIGGGEVDRRLKNALNGALEAIRKYIDRKYDTLWWWGVILSILVLAIVVNGYRQNRRIAELSRLLGRRP